MEKSYFFNSVSGDRKYLAEDFASYFSNILSNGVFLHEATALKVTPSSGLTVAVAVGKAFINGYGYENTTVLTKTLETVVANRIDRIAVRLDMINRTITAVIKKGTAASTPSAPALIRNADTYELGIADIYLAAGTTIVTDAMITDLRANSTYCGGVTMTVDRDEILGDITKTFAEFMQAGTRENINTNETTATVLGKIKKYFADLKTLAFLSSVGSEQIDSLAVSTAKLAASAVTTAKLAASAVTTEKLSAASVTAAKLARNAVTLEKIADGVITNAKIATNAAIAQSKIAGLIDALAAKLESSGTYPNLTAGAATRATNDVNNLEISTNYIRLRRLANADSTYNAKQLSSGVSWTINSPNNNSNFILVHGMLTCANKYEVSVLLRKSNNWNYGWGALATYFLRSVNGTPNVSYGLVTLEFNISGNTLYLYANHPTLSGGYDDHPAKECYFALDGVYEIINSNK